MSPGAEWTQCRLAEVTDTISLWNPRRDPRTSIRYIDVSAISRDELRIVSESTYQAKDAPSRARKIVETGDTIFATIRPTLRRIAQVPAVLNGEIVSTAFCVLRPNRQKIDADYLYFAAQLESVMDGIASMESGASYPAVRDNDVLDQMIPLPPLPEQRAIATALNNIRASSLHQFQCEAKANDLKQAAMQLLFTRGLRGEAQKETEIGLLPNSWSPRTIFDLCDILSGGTPRKSMVEYWRGDIPWVSGKDMKRSALDDTIDHLSPEGAAAGSRIAPANSVLLLVRGMGLAKDLPVAVLRRPMAFNQDLKALVSKGEYSGSFLRSAIYVCKDRLRSRIVSSAHGTMTLNLNDVECFQIPCPSNPEEAEEIVTVIDAMDRKVDLHRRKRAVLQDLLKALLHKLMTGEVRITDLDLSALPRLNFHSEPAHAHSGYTSRIPE